MNEEDFIDTIKEHVFDAAVEDVMKQVVSPSGRKPDEARLLLSNWFHMQDEEAQSKVRQCVREGAHAALFGMLCVLDGVRLVHEELRHGKLRLILETDSDEVVLSDNQQFSDLHDIFNATKGGL